MEIIEGIFGWLIIAMVVKELTGWGFITTLVLLVVGWYSIILAPVLILKCIGKKCPHGIRKGKEKKDDVYRCPECQREYEKEKEERRINEEKRKEEMQMREIRIAYKNRIKGLISSYGKLLANELNDILQLSPYEFEDYVAALFREMGYIVEQTPYSNDGGKDGYLHKDGIDYLLECKRYAADATVSRPLLQKLFAAMNEEGIPNGIFVTTGRYSQEAIEYGNRYGIKTIDGNQLTHIANEVHNTRIQKEKYSIICPSCGEEVSFNIVNDAMSKKCSQNHQVNNIFYKWQPGTKVCLACGNKLVKRVGPYSEFYGCVGYPQCTFRVPLDEYDKLFFRVER